MINRSLRLPLAVVFAATTLCSISLGAADNLAASNRIFAQSLVNQACQANPTLVLLGIHATAPGSAAPAMVACNLDRIGKKDSADDIAAAKDHKTIGLGTLKQSKFVVLMPLKDAQGAFTGAALGVAFPFHAGDDEAQFFVKAAAIAQGMARQITGAEKLFEPTGAR